MAPTSSCPSELLVPPSGPLAIDLPSIVRGNSFSWSQECPMQVMGEQNSAYAGHRQIGFMYQNIS